MSPAHGEDDLLLDDVQAADAEYYRLVLRQMIDVGVTVAHAVSRAADTFAAATLSGEADARDGVLPDIANAYDRVARAVRRTITLARRIGTAAPAARPDRTPARTAARKRIIREVEDALDRHDPAIPPTGAVDDREHLRAEFAERLDDPALDDDIATRPVADIIADICRDLGLVARTGAPGGKRRTPKDIRSLCAQAARHAPAHHATANRPPPGHASAILAAAANGALPRTAAPDP